MPSLMATSLHWHTHSTRTNYKSFSIQGLSNRKLYKSLYFGYDLMHFETFQGAREKLYNVTETHLKE